MGLPKEKDDAPDAALPAGLTPHAESIAEPKRKLPKRFQTWELLFLMTNWRHA